MAPTVKTRQYIQGVAYSSGVVPPQCGPYMYDMQVACPTCTYTMRFSVTAYLPSAELLITQEQAQQQSVTTVFLLKDPATNSTLWSYQHVCTGYMIGSGLTVNTGPSYAEVDMVGWMRSLEEKLDVHLNRVDELSRLTGLVKVMREKLDWTEEELRNKCARIDRLFQQLVTVHEALDCPCEMDFQALDTDDLLEHLIYVGALGP